MKVTFEEDIVENWYEAHGHDYPEYLPYWIRYLPYGIRIEYLRKEWKAFKDFDKLMLTKDFDWKSWVHYTGED